MIEIIAKGTFKPNCVEIFKQLAHEMIVKTRQESGCVFYQLCRDASDPNTFVFVETWHDQAAIDAHNQSPHFTTIVPQLADLLAEPMEVKLYTIIE
ncbi:MAG: antibiotic biosynthesis monooxygenase [Clostridia bacterium]|nr:antibiotic biosynthesis monooxygenase [Clostridia bacterium]NCC75715.1 antibiotic biosynthesis monooxygenase [Clostridia bacterium]